MPRCAQSLRHLARRKLFTASAFAVEALESRRLLASIVVNGSGDNVAVDGVVTLSEALASANDNADINADVTANRVGSYNSGVGNGVDTINFGFAGAQTIQSPGFILVDPVAINGYSQAGSSANTLAAGDDAKILVTLDGVGTAADEVGFYFQNGSQGSSVRGLSIVNYDGSAIRIANTSDLIIAGNFLGVLPDGTTGAANDDGVNIYQSPRVTVGGTAPADRNIISWNDKDGVIIQGDKTVDNFVQGNFIGTTRSGLGPLGNSDHGVKLLQCDRNTVGGTTAGARNVISANGLAGVIIDESDENVVAGNYIGLGADGATPLGNGGTGVFIEDGSGNTVGGTAAGARNVIGDNDNHGVSILNTTGDQKAADNKVLGNYIGTDATGLLDRGNENNGVYVSSASRSIIGAPGAGNVIAFNGDNGVSLDRDILEAEDCKIQGNFIGVDVTGNAAAGNSENGVRVEEFDRTLIGGTTAGAGNVISGNVKDGVFITSFNSQGSVIQGNFIGTNATGTAAIIPNNENGIHLTDQAQQTLIGGDTPAARNIISGNKRIGVLIEDGAFLDTVQGNYIGLNATGDGVIPNEIDGVLLANASNNQIGGLLSGQGNVISGNEGDGVHLYHASNNVIQGNRIGLFATGATGPGNKGDGIFLTQDSNRNQVGGAIRAAGNIIAFNERNGVANYYDDDDSVDNTIRLNSIYSNGRLGINLESYDPFIVDGPSPNDFQDVDNGPNRYQNFPVLASAIVSGGNITIQGTFNSTPNRPFVLDFYSNDLPDPTGFGEGKNYVGALGVVTNSNGDAVFNVTLPFSGTDKYLAATAWRSDTAPFGDTSEFSQDIDITFPAPPPPPPTLSISDVSLAEGHVGTKAFDFTVTRSGSLTGSSDVYWSTASGSATTGTDYTAVPLTLLHFNAGEGSKTVTVLVKGDYTVELDETFFVNLSSPTGATIADGSGLGTIQNDDIAPPPPPPNPCLCVTDPCDSSKTALQVNGSSSGDNIELIYAGAQGKVTVKINGQTKGTFTFTGSIGVFGNAGNDNITVDSRITRNCYLWGGNDNDCLIGGGGCNILCGNDGNDSMLGGGKRDICIGGNGADLLDGGNDDDFLIAGFTPSDNNIADLCKIQKEWCRTDKNCSTRASDIRTGVGYCGGIKFCETNVCTDNYIDQLKGGSGSDAFVCSRTAGSGYKADTMSDRSTSSDVLLEITRLA